MGEDKKLININIATLGGKKTMGIGP